MKPECVNILVTGAGSGLGQGLAVNLAAQGHKLLLIDLDISGLSQTAERIGDFCLSSVKCDVTDPEQISGFLSGLNGERVDVLINNAGVQHVSPVESFPDDQWDRLLDIMLKGPFLLSKAVLPGMRELGYGRIINIGSIHSLVASPFKSAYVAAKHGLLGLAKTIALETGGADITINTICPSYIRTPLVEKQIAALAKANDMSEKDVVDRVMLEPMPKKTFITIDEIAALAQFLIGSNARNITGQSIAIDGGWTAR